MFKSLSYISAIVFRDILLKRNVWESRFLISSYEQHLKDREMWCIKELELIKNRRKICNELKVKLIQSATTIS